MSYRGVFEFILEKSVDVIPEGSSLICHVSEEPVEYYGKLQSLFGNPTYETENLEEQFNYCLTAKDETGDAVVIYAYSGSSGPAIGGCSDAKSAEAAKQLEDMIHNASVVDYEYTGYYLDGQMKVHMGIRDGVPYMDETEMTEEEWKEVCKRMFGIEIS